MATPSASHMNTLPDPRRGTPIPVGSSSPATSSDHPDLSSEVATLSTKLINAINHQTNLDDALQDSKQGLTTARARVAELERQVQNQEDAIEQGILVRRVDAMKIQEKLRSEMSEERKRRETAEREKRGMEQELENLTSALFEEANGMVASARQEKEGADKKTEQLRTSLKEKDILLASHQEQLQDLKAVMQQIQTDHDDPVHTVTTPSTPINASIDKMSSSIDFATHMPNGSTSTQSLAAEPPLSFSHLLHPVVRTDTQAFDEFAALLQAGKETSSRATSGSYMGLNVMGLGKDLSSQSSVVTSQSRSQNASRSNSAQHTPVPGSFSPSPNPQMEVSTASGSLKDTKYYKRVLVEDIEPTLRLDLGPSLSWLTRRNVLSGMSSGHLIVEPVGRSRFPTPAYPCSLCGESRPADDYARKWRFRTSDNEDAQRYPLCEFCVTRVRATCDFTNFLRLAKNGHVRHETFDDSKSAWDECTRLRERMFWTRLGGGVVPVAAITAEKSSNPSSEDASAAGGNSQSESDAVSGSAYDAAASEQLRGDMLAAAGVSTQRMESHSPVPPLPVPEKENVPPSPSTPAQEQAPETYPDETLAPSPPHSEPTSPEATIQRFSTPPIEKPTSADSGRSFRSPDAVPRKASSPRRLSPVRPLSRGIPTLKDPTPPSASSRPDSATATSPPHILTAHRGSLPQRNKSPSPPRQITRTDSPSAFTEPTRPAQDPATTGTSRPSTPRKNNLIASLASKFQEPPSSGADMPRRPFSSGSGRGSASQSQSRGGSVSPVRRPGIERGVGSEGSFRSVEEG
ncbi:MAG: rab guanine nucleotide exchange factor S2 [Chrysothrix sp. TS-e1954]|nr:MAG: rab guanine nucleotide exchange factor S2 [Chrysothrix sp. TS-e1954]